MPTLNDLLGKLWSEYCKINSQARGVYDLLRAKGERVVNDHIAFRTFDHPAVCKEVLAQAFEDFGYKATGDYEFTQKKLAAKHYEHDDGNNPKIFISELKTEQFSTDLQSIVQNLVEQIDERSISQWDFTASGQPWKPITYRCYEQLRKESEYAAWLAAFGYCANHFTVLVNALESFETIGDLNQFLKDNGFSLNSSGGEIKGSPAVYLEQSSTLADPVTVAFADGRKDIPGCYYEFAKRYPLPSGNIFQGFVAQSADKIFESTDRKPS